MNNWVRTKQKANLHIRYFGSAFHHPWESCLLQQIHGPSHKLKTQPLLWATPNGAVLPYQTLYSAVGSGCKCKCSPVVEFKLRYGSFMPFNIGLLPAVAANIGWQLRNIGKINTETKWVVRTVLFVNQVIPDCRWIPAIIVTVRNGDLRSWTNHHHFLQNSVSLFFLQPWNGYWVYQ